MVSSNHKSSSFLSREGVLIPARRQWLPDVLEPMRDVSVADWISERLYPMDFGKGVKAGHIVPAGFEAYARLFHPAYRKPEERGHGKQVRWAEIAAWNGRAVHPEMQFHRIAGLPESAMYSQPEWGTSPRRGSLPPDQGKVLARLLRGFTTSPNLCYYCLWEGRGWIDDDFYQDKPRVNLSQPHLLFRGPLVGAIFPGRPTGAPNFWWPADRAWCGATEIDFTETLIGGSAVCIEAVLNHPELEALPIGIDARLDCDGDAINPPVAG
jgi:hypothetical protein